MLLPGIQALFGFQLIAVINDGFSQRLSSAEQQLHYPSIILTVIAVILVMTSPGRSIWRAVDLFDSAPVLLLLSMFPLALNICLEIT
jgi:hypothetical protein